MSERNMKKSCPASPMGPPVTGSTFSALAPLVLAAFTAEVRSLKACRSRSRAAETHQTDHQPACAILCLPFTLALQLRLVGSLSLDLVVLAIKVHLQPSELQHVSSHQACYA